MDVKNNYKFMFKKECVQSTIENKEVETRKEIIDLVSSIEPCDEIEKKHIDDAIKWIKSGVEIFRIEKPANPLKHLVCYTVLCDAINEKILLLEHQKAELLLPSGGHMDKGELPHETAKREIMEELGLDTDFLMDEYKKPFFLNQVETVGKTPGHIDVDLWYILKGDSSQALNTDADDFKKEFGNFKWYKFDEILSTPIEKFDPSMHRFVLKLKNHLNKS